MKTDTRRKDKPYNEHKEHREHMPEMWVTQNNKLFEVEVGSLAKKEPHKILSTAYWLEVWWCVWVENNVDMYKT